MIQDKMTCCTMQIQKRGGGVFMVKKGLDFTFYMALKLSKILKWKSACEEGRGEGVILAD